MDGPPRRFSDGGPRRIADRRAGGPFINVCMQVRTYVQSLVDTGVLQVGQSEGGGASEVLAGIFHPR